MPPKSSKKKKKGGGKQQRLGTAARKEGMARYYKSLPSLPPSTVIESIKRGEDIPLEVVFEVVTDRVEKPDKVENDYLVVYNKLLDAGLVSAAIGMAIKDGCMEKWCSSADRFPPRICIMLLANMSMSKNNEDGCKLQIAREIKPLINCMQNIEKREYFGSNKHWHESIKVFVALISNLALSDDVLDLLVHTNEGLTEFMVQAIFWGTHGSDIVKESKSYNIAKSPDLYFSSISTAAVSFIQGLVEGCDEKTVDGKKKIREIATMPIYGINGNESALIYGLIDIIKLNPRGMRRFLALLHRLTLGDCVDKDVIAGIIEFGYTSTKAYDDAMAVACAISGILIPQLDSVGSLKGTSASIDVSKADDVRFAYAISCGLFEVCLSLISRHGGHNNGNGSSLGNMNNSLKNIMDAANIVTFKKKSSKALSERSDKIIDTMNKTLIPENDRCQLIIRALKSIVTRKVGQIKQAGAKSICNTCSRYLGADEIRRCSKCNTSYCSRECQLEDWHNGGHKQDCKLLSKHAKKSQMGKKEIAFQENMSNAGAEMFCDNAMRFVAQAIIFQYKINDCVCLMDLRQAPPLFRLLPIDDFVSEYLDSQNVPEHSENVDNYSMSREKSIQKIEVGGSLLSGAIISHGVDTEGHGGLNLLFNSGDHWEKCVSDMNAQFMSSREKLDDPKVQEDLLCRMDKAESQTDVLSILKSVLE